MSTNYFKFYVNFYNFRQLVQISYYNTKTECIVEIDILIQKERKKARN